MNKNNSFCFIDYNDSPMYSHYISYQTNYIISQNITSYDKFKEIANLSYYMSYIKYTKCEYNKNIMDHYKNKLPLKDILKNE